MAGKGKAGWWPNDDGPHWGGSWDDGWGGCGWSGVADGGPWPQGAAGGWAESQWWEAAAAPPPRGAAAKWAPTYSCSDEHKARVQYGKTYSVMSELLEKHPGAFSSVEDFLDLGCAPGGFSGRLLEERPQARGFGVSMPVDKGGFPMLLNHARMKVQSCNLMDLQQFDDLQCPATVDLFLADAQDLGRRVRPGAPPGKGEGKRGKGGRGHHDHPVYEAPTGAVGVGGACALLGIWALTIQELSLGLDRLREGGSFVFRFGWRGRGANEEEWYRVATQRLFAILFAHFTAVRHFKSEFSHQADTTFYVVSTGFRRDTYREAGLHESMRAAVGEVLLTESQADLPDRLAFVKEHATDEVCGRIDALLESVGRLRAIGQATRQHVEGGPGGKGAGPSAALFISPVPFNLTMVRLRERLERYGKISTIKRRAHPIGVGADAVVQFAQASHAKSALDAITGQKVLGENISAKQMSDMAKT